MPNDMMIECEQKKEFRRPGGDVWEWKVVSVSEAVGVSRDRLRCGHCHGAVMSNDPAVTGAIRQAQLDHLEWLPPLITS